MSKDTLQAIAKNRRAYPARARTAAGTPKRPPASKSFPAFDPKQARADWQAACAAYDAASASYVALCAETDDAARSAQAERSKRLAAVYEEEDKLAVVMDAEDAAASAILAAPASIETLPGKLAVFSRLWARERRADQALSGGNVADVAAGIALDLLTMIRRGGLEEMASAA